MINFLLFKPISDCAFVKIANPLYVLKNVTHLRTLLMSSAKICIFIASVITKFKKCAAH